MATDEDDEGVWSTDYVLMASLHQCLLSEDRFALKRGRTPFPLSLPPSILPLPTGVEILGKLSNSLSNLPLLLSSPHEVYNRLLNTLILPDCELTMITLDSLYSLTLSGRELAHMIGRVRGLVDVLVWLLSFRIESLPPGSLAGMKLFFIGDSASLAQYLVDIQAKSSQSGVTPPTSVGGGGRGVVVSPLATNQIRSRSGLAARAGSPLSTNQIAAKPQGGPLSSQLQMRVSGKTVGSSLYSILGNRTQTGSPSEEFAIEWYGSLVQNFKIPISSSLPLSPSARLKQSYEAQSTHHLVLLVDMYAQYVLHCSSKGRKTFLSNTDFLSVLKSVGLL